MLTFPQAKEKIEQTIKTVQNSQGKGLPTQQILNEAVQSVRQEIREEDKQSLESYLSLKRLK